MIRFNACMTLVFALALGGCISYSSGQVTAMSTYDICALQNEQGANMTPEVRRLLGSELQRRKSDCGPHRAGIEAQRAEDLYDRMYRNQSP